MAQALVATTTTTTEVKLKPTLKRKLLTQLKTYHELKQDLKVIEAAMDRHRAIIEECVIESGEQSLALEGYKTTMVFPIRSTLDKKKLIEQGVTLAQIENATISKPGRHYVKVTCPGDSEKGENHE